MVQVLVARIGRPHGLRGEVTCQEHTDQPELRFRPGTTFATRPAAPGPLTLLATRLHNGIRLLSFAESADRTAAERLRGVQLLADVAEAGESDPRGTASDGAAPPTTDRQRPEPDAPGRGGSTGSGGEGWYEDQLTGLRAELPDGTPLGTVAELLTRPAQDLLVLALTDGRQAMVPFVHALVPVVDLSGGRVVVDPPAGLLDLESVTD